MKEPVKVETNEEKFNRLKDMGNKLVSKGDFKLASEYYSLAIDLYPDRVAPYSNRSLCHIKCDNPGLAVKVSMIVMTQYPARPVHQPVSYFIFPDSSITLGE